MYGFGSTVNNYQQLDRPLLSKQHQIMGWLCNEARAIITSYLINVDQRVLITPKTLSRQSFISEISAMVDSIKERLPVNYRRGYSLIIELMQTSLLSSAFNTDWLLDFGNASNSYVVQSKPRLYNNGTCNCVTSKYCNDYLRIGPPEVLIPGLKVGCSPIDGLRMSTLECFYSSSCINTIIGFLNYRIPIDGLSSVDLTTGSIDHLSIVPLNSTLQSRFQVNSSIGTIIDELFVERWMNISNYESYFSACSPSLCQYQTMRRFNIVYVMGSLLSLYGGLTVSIRFITWNGLLVYHRFKLWCTRRNRVGFV